MRSYEDMYTNVHTNFIYNSPKLETTQHLSMSEWVNKLWHVPSIEHN